MRPGKAPCRLAMTNEPEFCCHFYILNDPR
jgi:hypothetical protein